MAPPAFLAVLRTVEATLYCSDQFSDDWTPLESEAEQYSTAAAAAAVASRHGGIVVQH